VVHAVGWRVEGGRVGDVVATRSNFDGTVVFDDVTVDSLTIDNGANSGVQPVEYVFRNTKGISCSDVEWKRWTAGTQVVLNGVTCSP
jgi:hypothetical protein